jgi:hypothetical protein
MNKFLCQSVFILITSMLVASCSHKNNKITTEDSLANEVTSPVNEEYDSAEEEDFNNTDHSGPGLNEMIVDYENLDQDVKDFLWQLTVSKIGKVIQPGKDFLLLTTGPGIYPVVDFGNSSKDMLAIEELNKFMTDSAYDELNVYRLLPDKCTVIGDFPDGIYFVQSDLKRFSELNSNSDNAVLNKKLNAFKKDTSDKSGYEFVFKFTTPTGESLFVNILTFKEDGKLYIGAVDQSHCGT